MHLTIKNNHIEHCYDFPYLGIAIEYYNEGVIDQQNGPTLFEWAKENIVPKEGEVFKREDIYADAKERFGIEVIAVDEVSLVETVDMENGETEERHIPLSSKEDSFFEEIRFYTFDAESKTIRYSAEDAQSIKETEAMAAIKAERGSRIAAWEAKTKNRLNQYRREIEMERETTLSKADIQKIHQYTQELVDFPDQVQDPLDPTWPLEPNIPKVTD